MKRRVCVALVGLAVGCSDAVDGNGSSSGANACPDISGNYSVTAERVSGSCDPSLDPKTSTSISMHKNTDGAWVAVLPGIEGGCPGTLDVATCKFTAACEFKDKTGAVVGNASASYTFTATGYNGSSVSGLRPPVVAKACDVTYRETATKL